MAGRIPYWVLFFQTADYKGYWKVWFLFLGSFLNERNAVFLFFVLRFLGVAAIQFGICAFVVLRVCYFFVLNDSMCQVTAIPIAVSRIWSQILLCSMQMLMSSVIQSVETDIILIRSGSAFSSWKERMYVPSVGWLSNQWCSLGELWAKSHAERSRNGVVGSMGKNMPISPSVRLMNAMSMSVMCMRTIRTWCFARRILRLFLCCCWSLLPWIVWGRVFPILSLRRIQS